MSNKKSIIFTESEARLIAKLNKKRDRAEARYPLITGLFVTFGFVSVLYGFEKIIDQIAFFEQNPIILLIVGLTILGVTGTVYRKLN